MSEVSNNWVLHRRIEQQVPQPPERIGYAALQHAVDVGQRGRVKRAVSTLVGLDVLRWEGMRQGRAVAQGPRTLDEVLDAGLMPMPEREIQTYPLLLGPLDDFITRWHLGRGDPIDASGGLTSVDDGVTPYVTSSLRAIGHQGTATHTRPDLTVVVDLEFEHFGSWNDIHAVEVKPYWAVNRGALFEAAAQAALRRCTFSWLLAWIPDPDTGHFRAEERAMIKDANAALDPLRVEAAEFGLGVLVARSLSEDSELEGKPEPRRQAIDPHAADELFRSLQRRDSLPAPSVRPGRDQ